MLEELFRNGNSKDKLSETFTGHLINRGSLDAAKGVRADSILLCCVMRQAKSNLSSVAE